LVPIPEASNSKVPPPTTSVTGQEDDNISVEQNKLQQQLLEVTPGSTAAENLMESLEEMARKISHSKSKTTASLLGIFAKALWKDRQGIFPGIFCDRNQPFASFL
jgi:hypothetical protein